MRSTAVVVALLLAGCFHDPPATGDLPPSKDAPPSEISVAASGLDTVWEIAFALDGRTFLTERPGRVRVLAPDGTLNPTPWATLDVAEQSEAGLMGLALHPRFPTDPRVYVYHTARTTLGLVNRLVVLTDSSGRGTDPVVLLDGIPGASIHDGGRLRFGPDGALWIATGDAGVATHAQDPTSLAGKILRVTAEGAPAPGNPQPSSAVYTLGHRNPQGIAFRDGLAYAVEHGPENHDEVNLLTAGGNYGWPVARGPDGDPAFRGSIWTSGSTGTIAPSGAAVVEAPGSPLDGALAFGALKGRALRLLTFEPDDPGAIARERPILEGDLGRIRAVTWHAGALWLGTSNHDGRGTPGPQDDRVVRVPLAVLEELGGP